MIRLSHLLSEIDTKSTSSNLIKGQVYSQIEILEKKTQPIIDYTLYVIKASTLESLSIENPNVAFLIINDTNQKKFNINQEYAVFSSKISTKTLFEKARTAAISLISFEKIKSTLVDATLKHESIENLLDTASKYFNNPLILYDLSARPIATSNKNEILALNDLLLNELINDGQVSTKTLQAHPANIMNMLEQLKNSSEPKIWAKNETRKNDHITMRVMNGNVMVAHITLVMAHGTYNTIYKKCLIFLSKLLSLYFEDKTNLDVSTHNTESSLLVNLYNGTISEEDISLISKNKKWRNADRYIAICVKNIDNTDIEIMLSVISRHFQDSLPFFQAFVIDNKIIGLAGLDSLSKFNYYSSELNTILKSANLYAGCSMGFNKLSEFARFANQAEDILELGRKHDLKTRLYSTREYYYPYLVQLLAKTGNIKMVLISQLLLVEKYDKINNTELFNTVYTYIKCGCNAQKASEKLFLHRNTLMRRIERFEELTHIVLDEEEQYRLYLSFEIIAELRHQGISLQDFA